MLMRESHIAHVMNLREVVSSQMQHRLKKRSLSLDHSRHLVVASPPLPQKTINLIDEDDCGLHLASQAKQGADEFV